MLSDADVDFLEQQRSAAMITIGAGGIPKVARVGVARVGEKLWSSGTEDRVRTQRLRRDPRCVLYVHDATYGWLALETTVTILDGPHAAQQSVELFRVMQGKPDGPLSWFGGEYDDEGFRQRMVDERRVIYQFEVTKSYGMR
jgi:PPOX class probable F420-dependent enzyme